MTVHEPLSDIRPQSLEALEPAPRANLIAKRCLDLLLILPILVLLTPVFLLILAGYVLFGLRFPEDRGPVFRKVVRSSYGKAIPVYKFRITRLNDLEEKAKTLTPERVDWLVQHLSEHDRQYVLENQRLLLEEIGLPPTRFGRLMKLVYLDELPQVFNILLGSLSFVGPRPYPLGDGRARPNELGLIEMDGKLYDQRSRNMLPGGLTGLYQTNKSERALQDYATFCIEGVGLDREYYERVVSSNPLQVVLLDLWTIARTFKVLLEHKGV